MKRPVFVEFGFNVGKRVACRWSGAQATVSQN